MHTHTRLIDVVLTHACTIDVNGFDVSEASIQQVRCFRSMRIPLKVKVSPPSGCGCRCRWGWCDKDVDGAANMWMVRLRMVWQRCGCGCRWGCDASDMLQHVAETSVHLQHKVDVYKQHVAARCWSNFAQSRQSQLLRQTWCNTLLKQWWTLNANSCCISNMLQHVTGTAM